MELRDALSDAASTTGAGEPSLDDLGAVVRRATRPRRLIFTSALAATLVTGMTVGLVAARPSSTSKLGVRALDSTRDVQPGAPSTPAIEPRAAVPRPDPAPQVKPAGGGAPAPTTTSTTKPRSREGARAPEQRAEPKMQSLFRRTTSDGVVIRAYDMTLPQRPEGAEERRSRGPNRPGGDEAAECRRPSHALRGELSNDAAVTNAFAPIPDRGDNKPPTLTVLGYGHWGEGEGQPAGWVAAQTGAGVAKVRLTLEGGGTDEMAPVEGLAILARNVAKITGKVEALDASGKVLATAEVPGSRERPCAPRAGPRPGPGGPDGGHRGFFGGNGREAGWDGGAGHRS